MKRREQKTWDVAVVGGGPAGMMAAGRAAELGASVILIEKNDKLGKKLLITGGGRCNLTNGESDPHKLLAKFKDSGKFLYSAFSAWSNIDTIKFFNSLGVGTKVEKELRVFPKSDSAASVLDALVSYMKKGGVEIVTGSAVAGFVEDGHRISAVRIKGDAGTSEIKARSFVLATGGRSRPETGSTGDGFGWMKKMGHTVVEPDASLVPVSIKEPWVRKLQGLTLPHIKISVYQDGMRHCQKQGKLLFTHFGISGPTVLNMSREIRDLMPYGTVSIGLDLMPSSDPGTLNAELQELFRKNSNKKFKNSLGVILPGALAAAVVQLSGIGDDTFCHSVTRQQRLELVKLLKDVRMQVLGLLGVNKAIITSGGVKLKEVDTRTMRSARIENLYLAGDVLDIDRPSGGYSLQLCWTTGYVAGSSAATAGQ